MDKTKNVNIENGISVINLNNKNVFYKYFHRKEKKILEGFNTLINKEGPYEHIHVTYIAGL